MYITYSCYTDQLRYKTKPDNREKNLRIKIHPLFYLTAFCVRISLPNYGSYFIKERERNLLYFVHTLN